MCPRSTAGILLVDSLLKIPQGPLSLNLVWFLQRDSPFCLPLARSLSRLRAESPSTFQRNSGHPDASRWSKEGRLGAVSEAAVLESFVGESGLSSCRVKIAMPKIPGVLHAPKPVKIIAGNSPFPALAIEGDDSDFSTGLVANHHHSL